MAMIETAEPSGFSMLRRALNCAPEAFLALFLTAGTWKSAPVLSWLQSRIDLTFLCAALACLSALPYLVRGPWIRKRLLSLALFIGPMAVLAAVLALRVYPQLSPYGLEKASRFAFLTCPAFVVGLVAARNDASVRRLAACLVTVSMVVVLAAIVAPPSLEESTAVTGYLGLSRLAGLGALAAFGMLAPTLGGASWRAVLFLTCWPLGWWLLIAGARGPLFASLAASLAYVGGSLRKVAPPRFAPPLSRHGLWLFALVAGAVVIAPAFDRQVPIPTPWRSQNSLTTADRMEVLYREGGASYAARLRLFRGAVDAFLDHPLVGTGTGTFREGDEPQGTRAYPHNLLLEVAAEAGVLGLAPLAFLLSVVTVLLLRNLTRLTEPARIILLAVLALFVYTLANAMVSGDINDNRVLFAVCGLVAGLHARWSCAPTDSTVGTGRPCHQLRDCIHG